MALNFDTALRRWFKRPRCLKLLKQAFHLLQSFLQLVADVFDAAQIDLHLRSTRLIFFLNLLQSSHKLPNAVFWEDSGASKPTKILILLVGAAGFEPATCSTQNCRATRLRYTPPVAELDSPFAFGQQATAFDLSATEKRPRDAIAGGNTEFARGAGDDLKHRPYRTSGRDQLVRHRFGIFRNAHHAPIAGDKNHVEGNIGVVHPELDRLVIVEIKQHAAPFRQLLAVHQADRALRAIGRKLNRERMHAGPGHNLDRVLSRGAGRG
jgi:hypothetical protein